MSLFDDVHDRDYEVISTTEVIKPYEVDYKIIKETDKEIEIELKW